MKKKKGHNYLRDLEDTAKWYILKRKKEGIFDDVHISTLLANPIACEKLKIIMEEENERRKDFYKKHGESFLQRYDSEYQSEMGKLAHKKKLETGYYKSKKCSKANAVGGHATAKKRADEDYYKSEEFLNHVEKLKNNNHFSDNGKKTGAKMIAIRDVTRKKFLDSFQSDTFTRKELVEHAKKTGLYTERQAKTLLDNKDWINVLYKGRGGNNPSIYKRIK